MKWVCLTITIILTTAILKFESVEVVHYVKVNVKARKILEMIKGWLK